MSNKLVLVSAPGVERVSSYQLVESSLLVLYLERVVPSVGGAVVDLGDRLLRIVPLCVPKAEREEKLVQHVDKSRHPEAIRRPDTLLKPLPRQPLRGEVHPVSV